MICPQCGGDLRVIDSRADPQSVYRRRKCIVCDFRFSTTEINYKDYESVQAYLKRVQEMLKTFTLEE